MNTKKLFLYALSMLCCFGAVNANEIKDGERITIGERASSDSETAALYEARLNSYKLDEEQKRDLAEALQTLPTKEILAASQIAKARFLQQRGLNEASERAAKKGITTNPNVFHFSVGFYEYNIIELEDGSRWKIYSGDLYLTNNWLTTANSFTPDTIIIEPNQNWPKYSNYRYMLTNQQTSKSVRVNLSEAPIYNGVYTRYIDTYTIFVDIFGFQYVQLLLNDGSVWNMLANDHPITSYWHANDTVIMGCNNGPYTAVAPNILININRNDYAAGACVKY